MVYMVTPDKENRRGYVYIKIGHSTNPTKRLMGLQTGNPIKLQIAKQWEGDSLEEICVQWALMLMGFHVHYEWFEVPTAVYDALCSLESIEDLCTLVNSKKQLLEDTKAAIATMLGLT